MMAALTASYPHTALPEFSQTFGHYQSHMPTMINDTEATLEDLAAAIRESMQPGGGCVESGLGSGYAEMTDYQMHPTYTILATSEERYISEWMTDLPDMPQVSIDDDDDNQSVVLELEDLSFLDEIVGTDCNSDGETSIHSSFSDGAPSPTSFEQTEYKPSLPAFDQFWTKQKPELASLDESDEEDYVKPYCKSRRGAKNVLLWKFILQVLENRPDLAKWVNRSEGTFKFVDTTVMSRMWGEKKRKRDMTFEKLSRGIRHYYKSGLMSRIEGTRLVYKFNWPQVPKPYRKN
ncbi:ETS-related transcription factor Elf-1-like [Haliotis rufescens]|uniref:ETS-related transcription factor Elf-1-like n=1 Tax=Haliotis rufescens TaxID=6454 RepID=UPI001EAFDCB1|nr:ETS-related transcription factor Elf-1-like [Haliotis rufescens]XP_046333213.1 ETS-related transcription factor Elf-1-like [Haliotis rufescens]